MKASSVTLDRVLYRILMDQDASCFTIMELRDVYLKYVDPNGATLPQIRVYLYDQIRRMIKLGWAAYHAERRTRGQRFMINEMPPNLKLILAAPKMGMMQRSNTEESSKELTEWTRTTHDTDVSRNEIKTEISPAVTLQKMLKEVRLDFLTTLGATERYRILLDEVPNLKETLEPELTASRDNSSRLLGHMNALEATIQKLGAV